MSSKWCAAVFAVAMAAGADVSDIAVSDPSVLAVRESKTYYLYSATAPLGSPGGVQMSKSKDLITWDGPHTVFSVPEGGWADPAQGVSMPEVLDYRGRYFLAVTLQNPAEVIDRPPDAWRITFMRGTQIFVSDSPEGPFERITDTSDSPTPPADFMTQDGTLFIEGAIPYMIYAHSWEQTIDGYLEAIELEADLTQPAGEPIYLFKASDAPWLRDQHFAAKFPRYYPAARPQMYRTRTGRLLMLWSGYRDGFWAQTVAYSLSDQLRGPWRQAAPILGDDRGRGSIFETFDGRLMLVLRHPRTQPSRLEFYELEDTGDTLRILRSFVP